MTWAERVSSIQVGTTVAYSRQFLRNTGQYTGDAPAARGVVTALKPWGNVTIAHVMWDHPDLPGKILVNNLSAVRDGVVLERD